MKLKGTNAIITGSSGRLGGVIALALAAAGCNCICHYKSNRKKTQELVEHIEGLGVKALAVGADLARPEGIDALFEKVSAFGPPGILINSAAVFSRQALAKVSFSEAQDILALNLVAPILASKAFAKIIETESAGSEKVAGKIINIADIGGIRPWAEHVVYCSSKSGLIGATKALAKELAPVICVNSVAVGLVSWPDDFDESQKQRQLSLIPVKRIGEPQEVAKAIIFLLENDYITGQVLNIDGGRCI